MKKPRQRPRAGIKRGCECARVSKRVSRRERKIEKDRERGMRERAVNSNAVEMIRKTRGTAPAGPKQIYGPPDRRNYFV